MNIKVFVLFLLVGVIFVLAILASAASLERRERFMVSVEWEGPHDPTASRVVTVPDFNTVMPGSYLCTRQD